MLPVTVLIITMDYSVSVRLSNRLRRSVSKDLLAAGAGKFLARWSRWSWPRRIVTI